MKAFKISNKKYNNRNCIELEIEKDFSIKEITNTYFESKEWENYE